MDMIFMLRIDLTNPIVRQVGLVANSARYANDLSIVDKDGSLYVGDRTHLENWLAYDAPLFAPSGGKVETLVDGIPDNGFEKNGEVAYAKEVNYEKTSSLLGDYIVIDHGNGEFSLFAHLKSGSFKVKQGDTVRRGQPIAKIGFSGDADFVHTHYQLQNNADPATAEGLPTYFHNFWKIVGGKRSRVLVGAIDSGDVVIAADTK
ncbi:MAG TPA: M23 family metallopeptidase [Pyrinomonadaceae bacterium]|nr:M23 family metallopeptidase [Pyrinomonadaceae bacterium]